MVPSSPGRTEDTESEELGVLHCNHLPFYTATTGSLRQVGYTIKIMYKKVLILETLILSQNTLL